MWPLRWAAAANFAVLAHIVGQAISVTRDKYGLSGSGFPREGVPFEASQHSRQAGTKEQGVAACILATPTNALPPRAQKLTCAAIRWRSLAAITPEGSLLVMHSCRPLQSRRSPADRSAHHTTSRIQDACAHISAGPEHTGRLAHISWEAKVKGGEIHGLGNIQGWPADASRHQAVRRWAVGKPWLPASLHSAASTPWRCGAALAAPPTPCAEGVGGLCVNGVLSAAPPPAQRRTPAPAPSRQIKVLAMAPPSFRSVCGSSGGLRPQMPLFWPTFLGRQ